MAAAKKAVETVEETLDTIEQTLDVMESAAMPSGRGKFYLGLTLVWVGGAAAGSLVTYLVAKKRLEAEYDERVAREVQESVDFLASQNVDLTKVVVSDDEVDLHQDELPLDVVPEEYGTAATVQDEEPEETAEVEGERIVETKPDPSELVKKNQAVAYHKVFEAQAEEAAQEVLAEAERVDDPDFEDVNPDISVIGRDLFMTNVSEYEQATLTYFSDNAVLDLQGDFVPEHETLIGVGHPPFGLQSEDENIVYLRNKKLEKEFEVIYDSGEAGEFLRHSLGEMYGRDHSR